MIFQWCDMADITSDFVGAWRNLGKTSSSTNIYLMPEFMLPAIRHLEIDKAPKIAVVWNDNRSAMLALAIFNGVLPSWRFPFRRLISVKSIHSFQSGILLRTGFEGQTLDCLLNELLSDCWCAIEFREFRADSLLFQQLREVAYRHGLKWIVHKQYQRASLVVGDCERWRNHVSTRRQKRLRKARLDLREYGKVETRIVFNDDISDSTIQDFLRLESLGWKANSSFLAAQKEHLFFNEMTDACRSQGMLFFCELLVNGQVIASTANFHLNKAGFAFKVAMDPVYAKFSPGLLVEYGFLEACERNPFPFFEIESGAQADSYIEVLWPGRVTMVSGEFVAGALPFIYSTLKQLFRRCRRTLLNPQA